MSTPNKNGMDIGVKRLKMGLEINVNLGFKSGGNAHQGGHLWLVGLIEDAREVGLRQHTLVGKFFQGHSFDFANLVESFDKV